MDETSRPRAPASLTHEQRAELRRLEAAAEPANWDWWPQNNCLTTAHSGRRVVLSAGRGALFSRRTDGHLGPAEFDGADLTLLVAARNALPALLDALDAADAEIARLRKAAGWRCFQCGQVFVDEVAARDHFSDGHERAGCVDPLTKDEQARLGELRGARDLARAERERADQAEASVALLLRYQADLGRLFGDVGGVPCSTPQEAWLVYEAKLGEVEALTAEIARLRAALAASEQEARTAVENLRLENRRAEERGRERDEARAEVMKLRALAVVARQLVAEWDRRDGEPQPCQRYAGSEIGQNCDNTGPWPMCAACAVTFGAATMRALSDVLDILPKEPA